MGHVLTEGLHGPGRADGPLERLDPRARILGAAAFGVVTVACTHLAVLAAALALAFGLLLASGLPPGRALRRMAAMDGFILLLVLTLPFTTPGAAVFTLWGLPASREGLVLAAEILLTANAVVLALLALVGSLEPVTLGHALHRLRTPERLVHLMMFNIRYVEVLRGEYLRLRLAMRARGFRPATGWHSYRSFGYLLGMVLVRAVDRSERVLGAMKCRGFAGRIPLLHALAYGRRDAVFAVTLGAALLALCLAEAAHAAA
ncbi:cobalt ECF transporter T component CbiQ [Rhodovulum strictum]|uniref:Cobalt ECF transporter T component CbiQ n=1 Tax=Rhodovulum strictum TaxID=58314 RepID=A0A844B807_9RHOB|nr:cobalt ECF transporter T component CbiQ [Rhodovulum strictum]MRH21760.1 cobalt ECF transporter T component CbiQ [Rhodovulum strictum]